ncbi:RsmB/NOP family class I SAM-dependent RNA methyltransferase [Parerythrobacter jejuensis]|uniref:RsmB/NOP family class I SAM-dependent RNA methyltransferase n=1 Tax=Parerythrobacter jejuensis TaxID=795812 RepID=A0A845AQG5_9SPHN|nr:RsmB/NOP family class I SAM-dependent RNA methyltransferase [Parerythrobacter jejuensis]MXP32540.1 RsmB/NOP family class I SAM-dependent RNA methyltransferase [Parerythrobacter jejuensis]
MTPSARVQAAIEILDRVIAAATADGAPADRIFADWARNNRYAGSKDRRAVRELVYGAIRACGPVPKTGRTAMLRLAEEDSALKPLFDGSKYGPPAIGSRETPAEGGVAPPWIEKQLAASGIEGEALAAMRGRAPLDIRVNALKASRETCVLPEQAEHLAAPCAMRLPTGSHVDQWLAYREGQIEVQDHGSQIACLAAEAKPGETVIDLCAGAGGKTLALAAAMENQGVLVASDTDRGRLSKLAPRAERAGAGVIRSILLDPGKELEALEEFSGAADCVFIDAPCSGTGTWRRKPEAKWRLSDSRLTRFADIQDRLFDIAAHLVKPGGRLVFVTCSLLDAEGADRFASFLLRNPDWVADPPDLPLGSARGQGMRLTPYQDDTDGFFIARAQLPC